MVDAYYQCAMNQAIEKTVIGRKLSGKPAKPPVMGLQPGDLKENAELFASLSGKDDLTYLRLRFGKRVRFHPKIRVTPSDYEI